MLVRTGFDNGQLKGTVLVMHTTLYYVVLHSRVVTYFYCYSSKAIITIIMKYTYI